MSTISKSFTATGTSSTITVRNGESVSVTISGTFVGTVYLDGSMSGAGGWRPIKSWTAGVTDYQHSGYTSYRLRCSAFTSGTIVCTLEDVADVVDQIVGSDGVVLARVTQTLFDVLTSSGMRVNLLSVTEGLTLQDGAPLTLLGAGTGTGDVVARLGGSATEGLELRVYEATVSPEAIETSLIEIPANSVILSVQANVETALTGGGTTVAWSIGVADDPDKYGTAGDDLTRNAKLDFIPAWSFLSAAEQLVLTGAATGGGSDGDTALTAGSVRVRVVYLTLASLDDAA